MTCTDQLSRRSVAAALVRFPLLAVQPIHAETSGAGRVQLRASAAIGRLETLSGGRLGVAALDTGSGRRIRFRAGERFPMCSTYKLLAAAAILANADRGTLQLDHRVVYGRSDLLDYAPIARKNVGAGFMTVDALCDAAVRWSDNTAANLLLNLLGGPSGWTRFARSIGDGTSRLDRSEPDLNTAIAGDPRDTTTPDAMLGDLSVVLLGEALSSGARERLNDWLFDSQITATLLHAGLPPGWRVGDKSGAGANGTRNDIGILRPSAAAPILATVYYTQSAAPFAARDQLIADVGRIIAQSFA